MLTRNPWDDDAAPELAALETGRAPWLDRLVDLHVLAEHGDREAADAAGQWISTDPDARRVWDAVERSCDTLRSAGESGHDEARTAAR